MSGEISNSPYPESFLDEGWAKISTEPTPDLSAITDFNAAFDSSASCIDPLLTLSNVSSPADPYNSDCTRFNPTGTDQTLSPEPDFNHLDFGPQSPGPYYANLESLSSCQSRPRHQYQNVHRRSVSMPPESTNHHEPPVIFHRSGHCLGTSKATHPFPQALKSVPGSRHSKRHAPYMPANRGDHGRYHLRKGPMPLARGPTSVPLEPIPFPVSEVRAMHSSSIPGPRMTIVSSPSKAGNIDPMLLSEPAARPPLKTLAIPMTVEQLKDIIREAVQAAVEGFEVNKKAADASGDAPKVTMEETAALVNEAENVDESIPVGQQPAD